MGRRVGLMEHQGTWAGAFAAEAERVRAVFGDLAVEIYHIGSTAVPGLPAKPIIDMLLLVRDIGRVDALNEQMAELCYEARGENGLPGRRYFAKGGAERTHHLHTYEARHSSAERHLAFRDYLRTHPDAVQAYGDLKRRLALAHPDDVAAYQDGKHDFCQALEQEALAWWRGLQESGAGEGN